MELMAGGDAMMLLMRSWRSNGGTMAAPEENKPTYLIRTYGLHWSIEHVKWGRQGAGNSGALLGVFTRSSKAETVDFRNQRGIYALYADYELVYIGQTGSGNQRLLKRLRDHMGDHLSERWNRFSWFGVNGVSSSTHKLYKDTKAAHPQIGVVLDILEAVSTAIAEPRLNLQRGHWAKTTKKYYQYRQSPNIDDDAEDE